MGTPVSTPSVNGSHPRAVAEAGLGLRGAPGIEAWAEEERRFPWRRLVLSAGAVLVLVAIGIVTAQRLLAPAPAPRSSPAPAPGWTRSEQARRAPTWPPRKARSTRLRPAGPAFRPSSTRPCRGRPMPTLWRPRRPSTPLRPVCPRPWPSWTSSTGPRRRIWQLLAPTLKAPGRRWSAPRPSWASFRPGRPMQTWQQPRAPLLAPRQLWPTSQLGTAPSSVRSIRSM